MARRDSEFDRAMKLAPRSLGIVCGVILILSIFGLIAAFPISLARASHDFRRAVMSEEQMAMVARIETALNGGNQVALASLLKDYRRSIAREAALLDRPVEGAAEAAEAVRADRLVALAAQPQGAARNRAIRELVAVISNGERIEAERMALRIERLRRRMVLLAVLLTVTALTAAALGAFGLVIANRRLSAEVAARTGELAAIERSRRLFFAKVSHELRTPVTVMRGEAEVALSDPRSRVEPLREALGHVVANAEFLDHRIEELLSLARAENGELALDRSAIDLGDVIRGARQSVEPYARSVEVRLETDETDRPVSFRGDARWLQQALVAVLDNAVKFSPAGGIVSLRMTTDHHTSIVIRDQGTGIVAGELPKVFEAYYQTESGRARGGTGLGLALARWVIERHGGSILADNAPQGGCVMTITLPVAA